jgi:hypothetical protein
VGKTSQKRTTISLPKENTNIGELYYRYIDLLKTSVFYDNLISEFLPDNFEETERKEFKDFTLTFVDFDNKLQTAIKDINTLWQNGEVQRAIYELDNKELIDQANQISELFNKSLKFLIGVLAQLNVFQKENIDATTVAKYLKDSAPTIEKQSLEFNAIILEIQRLINKRLQEL